MKVISAHQVVLAPQRCAVTPFLGPSKGGRWIDTGCHLTDGFGDRVYVHEHSVNEMNRLLGNPSRGEHREALERIARLEAELAVFKADLAEANRTLDAIDVIESKDFRARKKPGRKPEKSAA